MLSATPRVAPERGTSGRYRDSSTVAPVVEAVDVADIVVSEGPHTSILSTIAAAVVILEAVVIAAAAVPMVEVSIFVVFVVVVFVVME